MVYKIILRMIEWGLVWRVTAGCCLDDICPMLDLATTQVAKVGVWMEYNPRNKKENIWSIVYGLCGVLGMCMWMGQPCQLSQQSLIFF